MRAQIKVVLLVSVILTAVLTAVIWKTQSTLVTDQMNFVLDSEMKQIAPLKRLVTQTLDSEKNNLVRFASSREALGAGHATAFGDFDAIALVEPSNSQWLPTWIEKNSSLRTEKWPQGYDLTLIKSLPYARVKEGHSLWVRLSDAQGAPLFAILNFVGVQAPAAAAVGFGPSILPAHPASAVALGVSATRQAILVGFTSENPLASMTEDYIGSTNIVYLIDDRGYVASHVKKTYLGNSFIADPMTKDAIRTPRLSGTKQVIDMDGRPVLAHFEKIEHSNLTAVIATPVAQAASLASQQLYSIVTVGGGIGLLGLLLAWLVGGTLGNEPGGAIGAKVRRPAWRARFDDTADGKEAVTEAEAAPDEQTIVHPAGASFSDPVLEERRKTFEAVSSSMSARLREPLLAILGHAQLAKTKTSDAAVIAHADSIEREARLAKDAIERFQIIEESETLQGRVTETCDLEKAILAGVAEKAIEIETSGITLELNLHHVPNVKGRATDIENAVVHILDNSIEAMRDRPEKNLILHLTWFDNELRFVVKDSGIGMTRDIQSRAFEPFYKGFQAPRHMGLGLSFVQTTLKQIGAKAVIDSAPGEGTMVSIEFPVAVEARREYEAITRAPI